MGNEMTLPELLALAKPVSRSFYLTLASLPEKIAAPATLAYLLARISDSVADGAPSPSCPSLPSRRIFLETLQSSLTNCTPTQNNFPPPPFPPSKKEDATFLALPHLIESKNASPHRNLIDTVWKKILQGQIWDIGRMENASSESPLTWEETQDYCYLVAGSVGEFWTFLLSANGESFSGVPPAEMAGKGKLYGIALQLVNILRDRAEDKSRGCRYLADTDFSNALATARSGIAAGEEYSRLIAGGRAAFASSLPWRFAKKMLPSLLRQQAPTKLPRTTVYKTMLEALASCATQSLLKKISLPPHKKKTN